MTQRSELPIHTHTLAHRRIYQTRYNLRADNPFTEQPTNQPRVQPHTSHLAATAAATSSSFLLLTFCTRMLYKGVLHNSDCEEALQKMAPAAVVEGEEEDGEDNLAER